MKFGEVLAFLLFIYESSYYLVIAQTINKEKSDCTKLYNFLIGDSKDYSNSCCSTAIIECDKDNYITNIYL